MTIRVGTRGSALALAQARSTAAELERLSGEPCELVVIRTEGDVSTASLASIGGTGVFAGALRTALKQGRCDIVVHSLKDLPVEPEPGLSIAAVPEREDARDALCARDAATFATLPAGAAVGTGSPRRRAQVASLRPDLTIVDIRGNVDTRLGRVREGDLDAVVLSYAGLSRLGRLDAVSEILPLDAWPTAAGQGALAIEVREADAAHRVAPFPAATAVGAATDLLIDERTWSAVSAERIVLRALEAGCSAPIGVASEVGAETASLWASVHRPGGGQQIDRRRSIRFALGDDRRAALDGAASLLALDLLEAGAAELAPLGATA